MLTGSFLLFWFVYRSINTISKGRKIVIILLTIITIIIGYQFVINFYENSDYFQYRVEVTMEGKTSQRDYIYTTLWQHYRSNHNLFQVMFGEGAYSTQNIVGMKAHNDWLELLIDCGLLTILLYLFYWVCFVIDCRKSKSNALIYSMLGGCFIFTFVRTFFSMSFSDIPFYISMIMGYSFAYPIRTKHIYPNNSSAEILNSSCYCSTK